MSAASQFSFIIDDLLKSNFGKETMKNVSSIIHEFSPNPHLQADVIQNSDSYVILIDIPGCEKNNISCDIVNDNILQVKVKRNTNMPGYSVITKERFSGEMQKDFELPNGIDQSTINAKYDNGTLTIHFTKIQNKKSVPIM